MHLVILTYSLHYSSHIKRQTLSGGGHTFSEFDYYFWHFFLTANNVKIKINFFTEHKVYGRLGQRIKSLDLLPYWLYCKTLPIFIFLEVCGCGILMKLVLQNNQRGRERERESLLLEC